jgi:hypothetical protein
VLCENYCYYFVSFLILNKVNELLACERLAAIAISVLADEACVR